MQREIHSKLQEFGIGTKAQQVLKLQHEQNKLERKTIGREQREAEKERQYELRRQKKRSTCALRKCFLVRVTGLEPAAS